MDGVNTSAVPLTREDMQTLARADVALEQRMTTDGATQLIVPVAFDGSVFLTDGNDLIVVTVDGQLVRMTDFVENAQSGTLSEVLFPDGSALSAPDLLDQAHDMSVIADQLAGLEAAAGESTSAPTSANGAQFTTLNVDALGDGVGPRGVQPRDEAPSRARPEFAAESRDQAPRGEFSTLRTPVTGREETPGTDTPSEPVTPTPPAYDNPPSQGFPGSDTLVVRASGQDWKGWPKLEVYVDGVKYGTFTVDADRDLGQWGEFTVTGDFGANGPGKVELRFANDGWGGSSDADRNLYVDHITLNGTVIQAEGDGVVYDRDGKSDIAGQEEMLWGGKLVFQLGDGPDTSALFSNGSDTVSLESQFDDYAAGLVYDARNGNDHVTGGRQADTILGGSGNDTLVGDRGNDVLSGGSGNDVIDGGKDNDTLIGGTGDDTLMGGDGDDVFVWNQGDGKDVYVGGSGTDTIRTESERLELRNGFTANGVERIEGTGTTDIRGSNSAESFDLRGMRLVGIDEVRGEGGNDTIRGTDFADRIDGGSGHDTLYGERGDDIIRGGSGNDVIDGGKDNDTLIGGSGDDTLMGGDGDDVFVWNQGDGKDVYVGGSGTDTIRTESERLELRDGFTANGVEIIEGTGTTDIRGSNSSESFDLRGMRLVGIDEVRGEGGNDTIRGTDFADRIDGGSGNDTLYGERGDDIIRGGSGNDVIDGGKDNDTLIGGSGDDTLMGGDGDDVFVWNQGDGKDVYVGGSGTDTIRTESERLELRDGFTANGVERIEGTGTTDIRGSNSAESFDLRGMRLVGIDEVRGEGGNDTIRGTDFADRIDGGSGNDTLYGERGNDYLVGGSGDDRLDGGKEDDILVGGSGADILIGGDGNDTASYAGSGSGVSINLATGVVSGGDAAGDTLTSIENLTGSSRNDILVGNSGANVLNGGAGGTDILTGGGGADRFVLGLGGTDRVTDFTVGQDRLDASGLIDLGSTDSPLDNYLRVNEDGAGNTVVQVDQSGTGENFSDVMVLEGVSGVNLADLLAQNEPTV